MLQILKKTLNIINDKELINDIKPSIILSGDFNTDNKQLTDIDNLLKE